MTCANCHGERKTRASVPCPVCTKIEHKSRWKRMSDHDKVLAVILIALFTLASVLITGMLHNSPTDLGICVSACGKPGLASWKSGTYAYYDRGVRIPGEPASCVCK